VSRPELVVVDAATGRVLPGTPAPALVEAGRGHAWQMTEGIWRLAEPDDDEEAVYRSVRVQPGRTVCVGDGCAATIPSLPVGHTYACPFHVGRLLDVEQEWSDAPWTDGHSFLCGVGQPPRDCPGAVRGCDCRCHAGAESARVPVPDGTTVPSQQVDMSTTTAQDAPIDPTTTAGDQPGRTAGGRTDTMATKKATVKAGIAAILNGTATADTVLADVAAADEPTVGEVIADIATDAVGEPVPAKNPATRAAARAAEAKAKRAAAPKPEPKAKPAAKPAKAAKPAPVEPAAPVAGEPVVLLTVAAVDAIIASGDVALMTALNTTGRWVRPNGSAPEGPSKAPSTDKAKRAKYARRWRLAVPASTPGIEAAASAVTVTESRRGAGRLPDPTDLAKVREAKALIDRIDRMPAPQAVIASATDEAQAALETVAKATLH
jgi:hypothetical protein